ncbi:MAG: hypothetical protein H6674_09180 [Dehalococcoidia bacterium]|nr:hypothetical protein [Myxococcales bacterium]MCB9492220.1 hypothetical protein [Dehalococcoidia bacterium]
MNGITLTDFLYLAGIGLFLYWMMRRGGCGMHGHGHGGHQHGDSRGHGDHDDPDDREGGGQHRHHGC